MSFARAISGNQIGDIGDIQHFPHSAERQSTGTHPHPHTHAPTPQHILSSVSES